MARTRAAASNAEVASAPAADASPVSAEPVYFEVKLGRTVSFYGKNYTPAHRHVVDQVTLDLFGDAVVEKKQIG